MPARGARIVLALGLVVLVAGCARGFDPTGACTQDGKAAGAYPELEARIPTAYDSRRPDQLDSGRTCSTDGLKTLDGHGVDELRFAGGTWTIGQDSGLTLALFVDQVGPPLTAAWMAEFYESTARTGKNVQTVETSDVHVNGSTLGKRLDVLNGESFQTVVVWDHEGQVHAALVANFVREIQTREAHDKIVDAAVRSWPEVQPPSGG